MSPRNVSSSAGKPRRRWLRLLLKTVGVLALISVLQVIVLRFVPPPMTAFMLWRQVDARVDGDKDYRWRYNWRPLGEMSPNVPVALVAAEDQLFAEHYGFDVVAIEKAYANNAKGKRVRGGSTISQQVAKNLFLWSGGGYFRKGLEAWYTLLIETLWPKHRIIEMYANIAEMGDGVYGAQAAARKFWRTDAKNLSRSQAARLAAVLPNPKRYNAANPGPYVSRRARWIERQMGRIGGRGYLKQLD